MTAPLAVYLEMGAKRTFAGALEWPGWCRSGRTEAAAIESLLVHQDRYAAVVARSGLPSIGAAAEIEIVERLTGGSGTDFGVPSVAPAADDRPLDAAELDRQSRLLVACWQSFDAVVAHARAADAELRTGPRGGGRDLPKIEAHVLGAEEAYLTQLGGRPPRPADQAELRVEALAVHAARARGTAVPSSSRVQRPWVPRYFVRRAAWHVLDHAWEIEDRSTLA